MEDINQLMPGDRRPPQLNIKELEEQKKGTGPGITLVIGSVDKFERKKYKDERRVVFYL